jgi:hypothetical protein
MATVSSTGTLTNREKQVDDAYNDSQNGYITLLQKQIDQATTDAQTANSLLQTANAGLNTAKNAFSVLKQGGFSTSDIAPIQTWVFTTISIAGQNAGVLKSNGLLAIPNPCSIEGADAWINQAQDLINYFEPGMRQVFNGLNFGGYVDPSSGKNVVSFDKPTIASLYQRSGGKMVSDLQNAIQALQAKVKNYQGSLVAAQATIDSQGTIVQNAQNAYTEASAKVVDLNKQMTQLRLQYQTDMQNAVDADAQATQQALQLQLASDPNYQAAVLQKQEADAANQAATDQAKIAADAQVAAAQAQAAADTAKAQAQAAADAAAAQANANASTAQAQAQAQAQAAAAAQKKQIIIIGASVAGLIVIAIVAVILFK